VAGQDSRRRVGTIALLALAAPLYGCMGFGSADKAPPATATAATAPTQAARGSGSRGLHGLPVAGQQAAAANTTQTAAATTAAAPTAAAADAPEVALLDVFRTQMAAGKSLTRLDDVYAERSAQLALEYDKDGTPRPWTNPETGTSGTVTPTRTYQENRTYCREFAQTIQLRERGSKDIKGKADSKDGVACRQPDGKWKFQS
jgi:surface antigen